MKNPTDHSRALAIDPYSRGFGFAILEGPENLIDWGLKEIREDKNTRCLEQVDELIWRYQPDVIVLEDYSVLGSRRCKRVQELIWGILKVAIENRIKVKSISQSKVKEVFREAGAHTKHQIASAIATHFPELGPSLPPFRKPWMSEDSRMSIFDAVGFGIGFYFLKFSSTSTMA